MTTMIVFPKDPTGPSHIMCGDENVFLRSNLCGLKSLLVDTLILLPGCSEEQRAYAIECTKAAENPIILG